MSTAPDQDFDNYNTRQLRQLETDLAVAQQRQDAAQAVTTSLDARYTACQQAVASSQANASTAAANLAAAQTTTQTVAHGVPLANEAQEQAVMIVAKLDPVLEQAHLTTLLLIDALTAIDALANQVTRRQGKNELISPLVTTGTTTAQTDAATALTTAITALQNTMLALAVAQEAYAATGKVIDASQRLRVLLAPVNAHFDPAHPADGHLWAGGEGPVSIRDLAQIVTKQNISILAVLDSLAQLAVRTEAEQQNATTQIALELNTANDRLNRTTAAAASAAASLAAAESAVA
jgi:hypothetical protein